VPVGKPRGTPIASARQVPGAVIPMTWFSTLVARGHALPVDEKTTRAGLGQRLEHVARAYGDP
jgi:hypothetical protein